MVGPLPDIRTGNPMLTSQSITVFNSGYSFKVTSSKRFPSTGDRPVITLPDQGGDQLHRRMVVRCRQRKIFIDLRGTNTKGWFG